MIESQQRRESFACRLGGRPNVNFVSLADAFASLNFCFFSLCIRCMQRRAVFLSRGVDRARCCSWCSATAPLTRVVYGDVCPLRRVHLLFLHQHGQHKYLLTLTMLLGSGQCGKCTFVRFVSDMTRRVGVSLERLRLVSFQLINQSSFADSS